MTMLQNFMPEFEYIFRILCAVACGVIIGLERDTQMKMAGVRTHSIVALTSAVIMIISKYGFFDVLGETNVGLDPSRIASSIVAAIGFLGAGVIFTRKQKVSGLTTAAGIWAMVGIGMAFGAGMYFLGTASAVCVVLLQLTFHRNFRWMRNPLAEEIMIELDEEENLSEIMDKITANRKTNISNIQVSRMEGSMLRVKLTVRVPDNQDVQKVVEILKSDLHIKSISI